MRLTTIIKGLALAAATSSLPALANNPPSAWDILVKQSEMTYWSVAADSAEAQARYREAMRKLSSLVGEGKDAELEELAEGLREMVTQNRSELEDRLSELSQKMEDEQEGGPGPALDSTSIGRPQAQPGPPGAAPAGLHESPIAIQPAQPSKPTLVQVGRDVNERAYAYLRSDRGARRIYSGEVFEGWTVTISKEGRVYVSRDGERERL